MSMDLLVRLPDPEEIKKKYPASEKVKKIKKRLKLKKSNSVNVRYLCITIDNIFYMSINIYHKTLIKWH